MTSPGVLLLVCAVLGWVGLVGSSPTPTTISPPTCKQDTKAAWTLDRNSSIKAGAVIHLLSSHNNYNLSDCAKACCGDGRCDVGLFDEDHGKCFLMNCEPMDKCVWAHHHHVTSIPTQHSHNTNAIEDLLSSSTKSADVTSVEDEMHLSHVLAQGASPATHGADITTSTSASSTNSAPNSASTTNTAANTATTTTSGGSTTTNVASTSEGASTSSTGASTSSTGASTSQSGSTANIQPAEDNIAQTIMNLAIQNNLTDPQRVDNLTRAEMNDILAKLIVKSELTNLTRNGVAFTISQLTDADLNRLVNALEEKQTNPKPTPNPEVVDPKTREIIANLAELAGRGKTEDVSKMNREELNRVLADLIVQANATDLTSNGAAFTISQLSDDDMKRLVNAFIARSVLKTTTTTSEPPLERNRGDPQSGTTQSTSDKHATVAVSSAPSGNTAGDNKTTPSPGGGAATITQHDAVASSAKGGISSHPARNAILITILTIGCVFMILVFVFIGKRLYDNWERRHYNKIDHLINGIYQ